MRILERRSKLKIQGVRTWREISVVSKKHRTTLQRILSGRSDANIGFSDLLSLLTQLGFAERIRGDHHILWKDGVEEIVNLQPKGSKAKPYQVKQVRGIIVAYKLDLRDA